MDDEVGMAAERSERELEALLQCRRQTAHANEMVRL
jgi:hypothetical protein